MEKLQMCRICLVKDVRMYIVVNRSLHELYEKLTDIPFVTQDSRPILACYFCCTKLKQCCRLLRQCLEAEEQFAQMMMENYEPKSLINQDRLEFYSGFIKSPIECISIVDKCQTESIAIKEELPAFCEGLDDIIQPKEEQQSDELETENFDNRFLDVADIPTQHSESDDDVSLMQIKIEVEDEEVSKKEQRVWETKKIKSENFDNSCLDVADLPPQHSESDLGYDVPIIEFKTEVEEVPKKKRRAREARRATLAKKPKLDPRRIKLEDAIIAEQQKNENSDSKVIRPTLIRTSEPYGTYYKEPYKCDQRSFNKKIHLKNHIRIHTGEKPFQCDVCHRGFSRNSDLTKHILIHTGEKPYKCDLCQSSFNRNYYLTKHIRLHTGDKPYKCDVCQRSFTQKSSLKSHIRIHTGEKPYECDLCQQSFIRSNDLIKHIRKHTGDKPYKCDVCQRSFTQKSSLTNHIRIHTGEKPYKCHICERTFREKGALTKHIRIHTGEKPYKCDVCQRGFIQNSDLTNHIRIHTGE